MDGVKIVSHPLVQHKLTLMREKMRRPKGFASCSTEIGMLLCYEVTRDLPLDRGRDRNAADQMKAPKIAGKKLVFAPILRAGMTFVEGMLDLVPAARVAHIGLYRDPETFVAVEYYFKAPSEIARAPGHRRRRRCSRPPTPRWPRSTGSRSAAPRTSASCA